MKQQEKYYKPEKDEFCIGFEYEIELRQDEWGKYSFPEIPRAGIDWGMTQLHDIPFRFGDHLRVKLLDKSDIESLGFELDARVTELTTRFIATDKLQTMLVWNVDTSRVRILIPDLEDISEIKDKSKYNIIFDGYVKNKLELVKLLKQLNI